MVFRNPAKTESCAAAGRNNGADHTGDATFALQYARDRPIVFFDLQDRLIPATTIIYLTENLYGKRLSLEKHLFAQDMQSAQSR
jgi:hypothetical protein